MSKKTINHKFEGSVANTLVPLAEIRDLCCIKMAVFSHKNTLSFKFTISCLEYFLHFSWGTWDTKLTVYKLVFKI